MQGVIWEGYGHCVCKRQVGQNSKGEIMRLSKRQLEIVDELQNGAHIWLASNKYPYICKKISDNNFHSEPIHGKAFNALKDHKVIKVCDDGKWRLA